jgi:tRNA/rRNA methyltransferase
MRAIDIKIVLVRTLYDSNIGATSRAMDNMGVQKLILIGPQCEITYKAQQSAATGQTGLQNRTTYQNWDEFFAKEPEGIRISFSARDGRGRAVKDFSETLGWLRTNDSRLKKSEEAALPVYLIFGPEDWGLSAADLEFSHFNVNIPTWGDNASLNLAQAVLLALFILRSNWGGALRTQLDGQTVRSSSSKKVFPENTLRTWLEEMGFDISSKRINVYSVLKRMLLHNVPTDKELHVLEIVLQQSIRKLREWKQLTQKNQLSPQAPQGDQESSFSESAPN